MALRLPEAAGQRFEEPEKGGEGSDLSRVLMDEGEGSSQDGEDYGTGGPDSDHEMLLPSEEASLEVPRNVCECMPAVFHGPKGKRTSRRPRQFNHVEEESAGGSDVGNDFDYESESDMDSASSSGGRDDEELARELDFQLNQTTRPRPTRKAARRANRRLQGQLEMDTSEEDVTSDPNLEDPKPRSSNQSGHNLRPSQRARTRSSQRAVRIDYKESSDGDGEEEGNKRKKVVPALHEGTEELDDEVEKILGHRDVGEINEKDPWANREFHVKWKRWAYIHCSWENRLTLSQLKGFKRVENYMKRHDDRMELRGCMTREEMELLDVEDAMEAELIEEHKYVERVVSERRQNDDGTLHYLVKWTGLPYSECTWENPGDVFAVQGGQEAVDAYKEREQRELGPSRSVDGQRRAFIQWRKASNVEHKQPDYLVGGTLRDYQLGGLNWLVYSWSKNINCILADEMGLGKTVQCVSFLSYLAESLQVFGPFLVVVPLSTVPNWIREFRKWAPNMNVVVYVGDTDSRKVIRKFEFERVRNWAANRPYKFEVLITTFDFTLKDAHVLKEVRWNYLLVDEAHRLKNADSSLYQEMEKWFFKNKLLVTGTPLQNTLKELWALLHFLDPDKFPNCEAFEENYSLENPSGLHEVDKLHADLRPHILRRVIKDVEKSLPPKRERILRVEMSPMQRQYYKWVLGKNFEELNKGASGGGHVSLLNIICELKKCCNHPFLFESAAEQFQGSEEDQGALERLIVTSGKMVLVDKLLTKLKETGHRVLIFSQMVRLLDILSAYLRLRGYQHQRLDGSTPSHLRHQAMEHFNAPKSEDFAFLLSTRAGGLGINLATADTVIIFDSDWNPQNDLQAMSRAHRIGQKDMVNIYRFVTKGTVEEDILERAKKKMVLDHLVIQKMDTSGRTVLESNVGNRSAKKMFGKDELASILRFGAEDLFKVNEAEGAEQLQKLRAEDIDSILERAEVVENRSCDTGVASELLNQFQVATFNTVEDDVSFWSKLIPESDRKRMEKQARECNAELGPRAARLRAQKKVEQQITSEDSEGRLPKKSQPPRGPKASTSKNSAPKQITPKAVASRGRKRKNVVKPGPNIVGATLRIDAWPEEIAEEASPGNSRNSLNEKLLTKKEAQEFVKACRRFGLEERLPQIAKEAGSTIEGASPGSQKVLWDELIRGCESASKQVKNPKDAILDFFGTAVKAEEFLAHLDMMRQLAKQIESFKDPLHFRMDNCQLPAPPRWRKQIGWSSRDDAMLLVGIYLHGLGSWKAIAEDVSLKLARKLDGAVNGDVGGPLGPNGSRLEVRVVALLKKIQCNPTTPKVSPSNHSRQSLSGSAGQRPLHKGPGREVPSGGLVHSGSKRQLEPTSSDQPGKQKKRRTGENGFWKAKNGFPQKQSKDESPRGAASDGHSCKAVMDPVKDEIHKLPKLRSVNLPLDKVLKKTRKYLYRIGEHIEEVVKQKPTLVALQCWEYVSAYASTNKSGKKYMEMYEMIKKEKVETCAGRSNFNSAAPAQSTGMKQSRACSSAQPRLSSGGGARRKPEYSMSGKEKIPRFAEKRQRGRFSPDPNEPSTVCRSVMDYMKLFGDDKDHLQRLEEVNSKAYRKRAMR